MNSGKLPTLIPDRYKNLCLYWKCINHYKKKTWLWLYNIISHIHCITSLRSLYAIFCCNTHTTYAIMLRPIHFSMHCLSHIIAHKNSFPQLSPLYDFSQSTVLWSWKCYPCYYNFFLLLIYIEEVLLISRLLLVVLF